MDVQKLAQDDPDFPAVIYLYQGTIDDGEAFFGWIAPGARAIADPDRVFYRAFGLERGGVGAVLGPQVWSCGMRASRKGHGVGKPVGDVWQMPGFFLVQGDRVLHEYRPRHIGDHPDWAAFVRGRDPGD